VSKADLPQGLKRLNVYLRKHGLEIIEPYDGIRMMDRKGVPCVLCNEATEAQIYIPSVSCIEFGSTIARVICADLAQCHKRCFDNEAKEKAAFEARLKAIEEHLVFPYGGGDAVDGTCDE
jgi:hypothetical protein